MAFIIWATTNPTETAIALERAGSHSPLKLRARVPASPNSTTAAELAHEFENQDILHRTPIITVAVVFTPPKLMR